MRATKSGSGQGAEKKMLSQIKPGGEGRTTNKTRISRKVGLLVVKEVKLVKLVNDRVQASRETVRQTQDTERFTSAFPSPRRGISKAG